MSYTPTEWKNGDIITAEKMNKIQGAIENYTPTEWKNGDIITAEKMNKIQQAIENLSTGGGGTILDALSVTENGTYIPETGHAYNEVNVAVPTEGGGAVSVGRKDVNFYDYDGTLLHSYSAAEALVLTALPENPSHSGLTAQGWNWSLSDMKSQVQSMGKCDIGQMYITDDGKTRIYVHFEEGRSSPYLGIGVNGTVEVDWGDGSSTSTLTGTSLTTVQTAQHIYTPGDYVITLTVVSGSFTFLGVSNAAHILKTSTATTANISLVYANAVQKIELGNGITGIGSYAFSNCYSLSNITIPEEVTSIGNNAFQSCYNLSNITIPEGVTSIGSNAFNSCYSLSNIVIPAGVTNIETYTFNACYSLSSIAIPEGVTSIGNNAFIACHSLSSIVIPAGVTSIGSSAFSGCSSLSSIVIPAGVTNIGNSAFNSCSSLSSITIPSGVTSIGTYAFNNCYSLSSITIPSGVTSIGSNAFSGCSSLSSIVIPAGVTYIETSAFQSCYSLSRITIPAGVTSIGTNAFSSCYGMAEYHFLPTTPPRITNKNVFANIQLDCIIYVPQGCLEAYQTATNWSNYANKMQEEAA